MGLLDALKQYVADSMPGGLLNPEFNSTNGQKLAAELQRGLLESTGVNARDKRRAWNKNQLDAVSGSSDTRGSLNQDSYNGAINMVGIGPLGMIKPLTPFTFIRNTEKAGNFGKTFAQDIEPAGRYLLEDTSGVANSLPKNWISGTHTFKNPMMLEWGGEYGTPTNWKSVLSEKYGGKTGKALSKAIVKDGYDGVVTLRNGETSEVVDLSVFVK